jgi:hypothetical protein
MFAAGFRGPGWMAANVNESRFLRDFAAFWLGGSRVLVFYGTIFASFR